MPTTGAAETATNLQKMTDFAATKVVSTDQLLISSHHYNLIELALDLVFFSKTRQNAHPCILQLYCLAGIPLPLRVDGTYNRLQQNQHSYL